MQINYTINKHLGGTDSFLRNIEYSAYYREALDDFKDSFPGLEKLNVDLQERYRNNSVISPREPGKLFGRDQYDMVIEFSVYPANNGRVSYPSGPNIFETIKYTMRDEVRNYVLLREKKNPPLRARLKQIGIDMSSNKDLVANETHGSLGSNNYKLDLDQRIWSLSDDDLYQLGMVIIVSDTDGKVFSNEEIVTKMAAMLEVQD